MARAQLTNEKSELLNHPSRVPMIDVCIMASFGLAELLVVSIPAGSNLEGNNVVGRPIRQHLSPALDCLAVQMANLWTYPGRCFHNNYFTTDHSMQLQCKSMKQRNWVIWPNDGKVNSLSIVAIAHQLIVKPNTPLWSETVKSSLTNWL